MSRGRRVQVYRSDNGDGRELGYTHIKAVAAPMTVAVSCNLPDGVVLGVDSAITVAGPTGVTKVYENADKLFRLGQRPIGIAVYGLGSLGARSIESYLREFEIRNPDKVLLCCDSLQGIVEALREFFLSKYREEVVPAIAQATGLPFDQIPREQIPVLGLLVVYQG